MMIPDELKTLQDAYAWINAVLADGRSFANRLDDLIKSNTAPLPLVIYSQRDPQWASLTLGTGATTIGQEGCLMTCAAQMLTECGTIMRPDALNSWLKSNSGFTQGNHFIFASIDKLNAVKFRMLGNCVNVPAPMSVLEAVIKSGAYIIAQVDFVPGGSIQQHWVLYRGDGKITDPWYGDDASITRYGKDAATAIIGYVIYDRVKP